eukprot:CAMPEP_0195509594 /NCGR_PEP_ID=MMETSP0794_2-20130614/2489_1 /TAXON_ID=515487 /ORGANISM="Stephanopyxis turris, Strain CCMP 815" /LENGTH=358 /DNA_ID=CAMNT_0040636855 /DNA_START=60 /DNA_END=1136 /DNA_ORIENTATION=-
MGGGRNSANNSNNNIYNNNPWNRRRSNARQYVLPMPIADTDTHNAITRIVQKRKRNEWSKASTIRAQEEAIDAYHASQLALIAVEQTSQRVKEAQDNLFMVKAENAKRMEEFRTQMIKEEQEEQRKLKEAQKEDEETSKKDDQDEIDCSQVVGGDKAGKDDGLDPSNKELVFSVAAAAADIVSTGKNGAKDETNAEDKAIKIEPSIPASSADQGSSVNIKEDAADHKASTTEQPSKDESENNKPKPAAAAKNVPEEESSSSLSTLHNSSAASGSNNNAATIEAAVKVEHSPTPIISKKKESEKKSEDLAKMKSEVDGLNRTKSQMIWLLKQVITAEKKRKEETVDKPKKKKKSKKSLR